MNSVWSEFYCCLDCYELICKECPITANLWMELCEKSLDRKNRIALNVKNKIGVELEILEYNGFILTHETKDVLWIKLYGQYLDDSLVPGFCICEDYEEEEM